jgi:hypothetical protein
VQVDHSLNDAVLRPRRRDLAITHLRKTQNLTFMGPCIVSIFQYISNKMQLYTVYLYMEAALHVSGCTSTHHQERIQLYLQHLVFVTPLLLLAAIAVIVWQIPDTVDTVVCAPDDGCTYHPKHVEQFPEMNKLCDVAPCWINPGIKTQNSQNLYFVKNCNYKLD